MDGDFVLLSERKTDVCTSNSVIHAQETLASPWSTKLGYNNEWHEQSIIWVEFNSYDSSLYISLKAPGKVQSYWGGKAVLWQRYKLGLDVSQASIFRLVIRRKMESRRPCNSLSTERGVKIRFVSKYGIVSFWKDGCMQYQQIHNTRMPHLGMHLVTYKVFHNSFLWGSI